MSFKWIQCESYILSYFLLLNVSLIYTCVLGWPCSLHFYYTNISWYFVYKLPFPRKKWCILSEELLEIIFLRKIISSFSSRKCKKCYFIMILHIPSTLNICSFLLSKYRGLWLFKTLRSAQLKRLLTHDSIQMKKQVALRFVLWLTEQLHFCILDILLENHSFTSWEPLMCPVLS